MSGHAGFAEYGKDIVCSAASILAFTAARFGSMRTDKNNTIIESTESALDVVMEGFLLLEENYPANLRVIKGG